MAQAIEDSRSPQGLVPDFLIVGSPRSGTTLIQRLASEVRGVVVPPETHFFTAFYPDMAKRSRFPLDVPALRRELGLFRILNTSQGLSIEEDVIMELLDGRCARPGHLYGAITRSLAVNATLVGEKTPDHLRWWFPLHKAYPWMKFVFVVRDPRGVVASTMEAGWGDPVTDLLTVRWRLDQQEIVRGLETIPEHARLLIRYEQAVLEPARTRARLARFLGLPLVKEQTALEAGRLFPAWEIWKERALGEISAERIGAWASVLSEQEAAKVVSRSIPELQQLGYDSPSKQTYPTPVSIRFRIARMRFSRWRERIWIRRQRL